MDLCLVHLGLETEEYRIHYNQTTNRAMHSIYLLRSLPDLSGRMVTDIWTSQLQEEFTYEEL
jgi:hypothetical protein